MINVEVYPFERVCRTGKDKFVRFRNERMLIECVRFWAVKPPVP